MNRIKNFIQFINEGAWYEPKGQGKDPKYVKVYLSKYNDPSKENELLKTVDPNSLNFSKRGLSNIKTFFGLYPRTKYKPGEEESDRAKTLIMNPLKGDRFEMAPGETLQDFLKFTVLNNIDSDINYIVSIGSSENLVKKMRGELLSIYPNAISIDLNKIEYKDWRDAIDWDSYTKKIESEFAIARHFEKNVYYTVKDGDTLKKIAQKKRVDINSIISFNPDIDPYKLTRGQRILVKKKGADAPGKSDTFLYAERWIRMIERDLLRMVERGEEPKFKIRTSGIPGSVRGVLRPKYNTGNEEFIDAISHCAFGDGNGGFGKMLIIDDNINQGVDLRDVANKITEILSGIIDVTKNVTEESLKNSGVFNKIRDEYKKRIEQNKTVLKVNNQLDNLIKLKAEENISKNIFSYALYNFGDSGKRYTPNQKFKLDLLKKSFLEAVAEIKGISPEEVHKRIFKDIYNNDLDTPKPIYIDKNESGIIYNNLLDKAAGEYQNISQDKKPEIIQDLKTILDANLNNIMLVREKEDEEAPVIKSKFPHLDFINVGDEVIGTKTGDTGIINSINRANGYFSVKITSGKAIGQITGDKLGLEQLDPNWTKGGIYKLKNQ
jgi:LysM repeat protein